MFEDVQPIKNFGAKMFFSVLERSSWETCMSKDHLTLRWIIQAGKDEGRTENN